MPNQKLEKLLDKLVEYFMNFIIFIVVVVGMLAITYGSIYITKKWICSFATCQDSKEQTI